MFHQVGTRRESEDHWNTLHGTYIDRTFELWFVQEWHFFVLLTTVTFPCFYADC